MIGTLIGLLLAVIIVGVIIWGAHKIMSVIPMAEPFKTIAHVIVVIIVVIMCVYILAQLLGVAGVPVRGFRML